MITNHTYESSPEINNLLIQIEANKQTLSLISPEPKKISLIRTRSHLKSGVYSAAIEGNPLTTESFEHSDDKLAKLEITNILDCLTWIYQTSPKLSLKLTRDIHHRVMQNLHRNAGSFRTEQSAIYNSAGVAIYLTPPPTEIPQLISSWGDFYLNSPYPQPIIIAILHYQFEKIHPFLDGNGRVGRLITNLLLHTHHYDLQGIICFDKELSLHQDQYYNTLNTNIHDITPFIHLFLTTLKDSQSLALKKLTSSQKPSPIDNLPTRRKEIYLIIQDHTPCSFDQIHRRFYSIPTSTLHYDLQQLQKVDLICKLGTTRGALYTT